MLLQVLLRRRGQVLSRELLLQEVWQGERSSSNVVEAVSYTHLTLPTKRIV